MMLESMQHDDNCFVTLTYSDDHLPSDGSLNPKHMQDWLKRFRKAIEPTKVRYYLVGEYGDTTQRPHYHIALFGFAGCLQGRSRYNRSGYSCCDHCRIIASTWSRGLILAGDLNPSSIQYVAGYVTKKMTKADDPRLGGRHPEFARMSLRPGIGVYGLHEVASVMLSLGLEESQVDVPSTLRHGKRLLPLGRFMKGKLREMVGREKTAPQEVRDALKEELRPLYEIAKARAASGSMEVSHYFKEELWKQFDVAVAQVEGRSKIYGKKGSL